MNPLLLKLVHPEFTGIVMLTNEAEVRKFDGVTEETSGASAHEYT
jgi:hypothetical protein